VSRVPDKWGKSRAVAAERRITSLAKHENPAMFMRDIMLFSCLVAFVAGLVIAAATLLI